MTQLSNVNKVDSHTGFWWTLLKARSSLHLGPVADVWLRVQSSHLSVFLMLTLCILLVCTLLKYYNYTECHNHTYSKPELWAVASHKSPLHEDMHACQSRLMDWFFHSTATAPRTQSYLTDMLNVHFLTVALEWLSFDVLNYPPSYCLNICSRSAAITLSCKKSKGLPH